MDVKYSSGSSDFIKSIFYNISFHYRDIFLVTLHVHGLAEEFIWYLTKKKSTVFRVIIKVTEKLVIVRWKNMG